MSCTLKINIFQTILIIAIYKTIKIDVRLKNTWKWNISQAANRECTKFHKFHKMNKMIHLIKYAKYTIVKVFFA